MKCYIFSIACCFQSGPLKKEVEIRAGGGVLELGNPGRRGALAVWEIQSEGGGQKCLPSVGGVCIFSGITHYCRKTECKQVLRVFQKVNCDKMPEIVDIFYCLQSTIVLFQRVFPV